MVCGCMGVLGGVICVRLHMLSLDYSSYMLIEVDLELDPHPSRPCRTYYLKCNGVTKAANLVSKLLLAVHSMAHRTEQLTSSAAFSLSLSTKYSPAIIPTIHCLQTITNSSMGFLFPSPFLSLSTLSPIYILLIIY